MKKITTFLFVIVVSFMNAQAYKGKGDIKGQAGAVFQSGATGLSVSADFGLGENMSYGFVASYMLKTPDMDITINETEFLLANPNYDPIIDGTIPKTTTIKPKFTDRADIKVRFNANLGSVIGLDKKMDVYPGLNLGLRNLGGQAGFRYFFADGFGVFGEAGFPIAKYDKTITGFDKINNQFTFTAGASFNL